MKSFPLVVVAIVLVLAGLDSIFARPGRVHRLWYARVQADLESLQHRRPPEVNRQQWGYVVGWTLNAHANCCSAPVFVDPALTDGFAADLERTLRGPVSLATIDRIWDKILTISRIKSYGQFRPTSPEKLEEATSSGWAGIEVD